MKLPLIPQLPRRKVLWALAITVGLAIIFGIFFRFYWLSYPNKFVFDEVYFPVFAKQYIERVDVYDGHPPLGKFIIAVGIILFGDNGIGWRVMPMLFGVGIIFLMGYLWWLLFKDKVGALIAMFLFAIDGLFMAYSRVGLMDGMLFFFMMTAFLAAVRVKKGSPLVSLLTLIGLTVAIKWVGLAILAPIGFLLWRKKRGADLFFGMSWAFVVYLIVVYVGEYLDRAPAPLASAIMWYKDAIYWHTHIPGGHPWGSSWWSWPFLLRPVLFLYDQIPHGVGVMTTLGNPLSWWAGTALAFFSTGYLIVRRVKHKEAITESPLFLFLLGYYACWLPWAAISRVAFLYHYMPSYGFSLLILTYWLSVLWKKYPWVVVGILVVLFAVSIFMLPFAVGWWPLSPEWLARHIWVKSWLY